MLSVFKVSLGCEDLVCSLDPAKLEVHCRKRMDVGTRCEFGWAQSRCPFRRNFANSKTCIVAWVAFPISKGMGLRMLTSFVQAGDQCKRCMVNLLGQGDLDEMILYNAADSVFCHKVCRLCRLSVRPVNCDTNS